MILVFPILKVRTVSLLAAMIESLLRQPSLFMTHLILLTNSGSLSSLARSSKQADVQPFLTICSLAVHI